jgi:hypothetical protein
VQVVNVSHEVGEIGTHRIGWRNLLVICTVLGSPSALIRSESCQRLMMLTMPKLEGNEYLLAFGDLLPRSSQSSTIVTPRDDRPCGSAIGGKVLAVDTGLE